MDDVALNPPGGHVLSTGVLSERLVPTRRHPGCAHREADAAERATGQRTARSSAGLFGNQRRLSGFSATAPRLVTSLCLWSLVPSCGLPTMSFSGGSS